MDEAVHKNASRREMLAGTPCLHPSVQMCYSKKLGYHLSWENHNRRRSSFFGKLLGRLKTKHNLCLDQMGKRTIELIDGKVSLLTIANKLNREFEFEHVEKAQASLLVFIAQLMQRNIVQVLSD